MAVRQYNSVGEIGNGSSCTMKDVVGNSSNGWPTINNLFDQPAAMIVYQCQVDLDIILEIDVINVEK